MHLDYPYPLHLTYCTNIHAAHGWREVFVKLQQHALPLKQRISPDKSFGLGLRLSADECEELLQPSNLESFKNWLEENGLYVFTLNGFPYSSFHGDTVKDQVHAPDWQTQERLDYTINMANLLVQLVPPELKEAGISTSPLSYKAWCNPQDEILWNRFVDQYVALTTHLIQLENQTGTAIHIDIEPEPDGMLETSDELVTFFRDWLLPIGSQQISESLGCSREKARTHLLHHIRVCYDTCHVGVAYENASTILGSYRELGIQVGKVQVSSALKVEFSSENYQTVLEQLSPFVESTYLHQVVEKTQSGSIIQHPDLPDAIEAFDASRVREWRIHFHVPIFLDTFGNLGSTQDDILSLFRVLPQHPAGIHFEIETYTWDVLPEPLKQPLTESIAREYEWVLQALSNTKTEE